MRWFLGVLSFCMLVSVARGAEPEVSGEARALLDQVGQAYLKLKSIRVEGKMEGHFDVGGERPRKEAVISGMADDRGRFYAAIVGESHMLGNGQKTYLYDFRRNNFIELDPITQRVPMSKLPGSLPTLVRDENPSIVMTLCTDPVNVLTLDSTKVARVDDTKIDGVAFPTLRFSMPRREMTVVLDARTMLIRRVELDYAQVYKTAGVPDVKSALVRIDYTKVEPDEAMDEKVLAWTPPRGAYPLKDAKKELMEGDDASADAGGPGRLKGEDAPEVELPDLTGEVVKLSDLKGKVVVLDFWATWCGPCVQLMPHIVEMSAKYKDKGAVIYGVNCGETEEKVRKFLDDKGWELGILMDKDNATQKRFGISGIPTTVVVGRDGKVVFVSVGAGPDTGKKIEEALESAVSEKP